MFGCVLSAHCYDDYGDDDENKRSDLSGDERVQAAATRPQPVPSSRPRTRSVT